ncbi:hypothetical protein F5878DRAFT_638310 [Lentinula raphanica]|uniref:Uncharacterized protein n=1 Tax=Lentinula raphanica TaxID=153919 RepID=A0AA38PHR3_9AGAR|nr:hypothetical protein F5878DRAFT_638310 [Lentinula raphanica]
MPHVPDDLPPPPPYEAQGLPPAPIHLPAPAPAPGADPVPAATPDVAPNGKKVKHDINRIVTSLVRKNWGDAYKAVLAKSKTEAVSWRARKAEEILGLLERKQGVFARSDGAREDCRKDNLDALRQCFRNIGSSARNQANEVTGPPAMSKQAAHVVVDGMFRLMGPAAGRILYEQAHKDDIKASAKDGNTGNAAGNYQQARKQSWLQLSEEERRTWEERAREEAQDVDRNQDLLLSIVNYLFLSLAKSGRLGNMEFLTLLAMRDTKGILRAESVIGGSSGEDFKDSVDDWAAHYLRPFQDWAEGVLPVSDDHRSMVQRDEAGYPLFPTDIRPLETPANHLQIMLKTFLELLYKTEEQYGEPLPWDELQERPGDFYDVVQFDFPVPLKDPLALELSIFPLVMKFKELESPFRFRRYVTPPARLAEPVATGSGANTCVVAPTPALAPPAVIHTTAATPRIMPTAPADVIPTTTISILPTITPVAPPAITSPIVTPATAPILPTIAPVAPPVVTSAAVTTTRAPSVPTITTETPPAVTPSTVMLATTPPITPPPPPAVIPTTMVVLPTIAPVAPPAVMPATTPVSPTAAAPIITPSTPLVHPTIPPATLAGAPATTSPVSPTITSAGSLADTQITPSIPPATISAAHDTVIPPATSTSTPLPGPKPPARKSRASKKNKERTSKVLLPSSSLPKSVPDLSPRKTRSVRKKEAPAPTGTRGKKRSQGDMEEIEELPGRKKSKFWVYTLEPVEGARSSEAGPSNIGDMIQEE